MGKSEFEPPDRDPESLEREINEMLARGAKDPEYRKKVIRELGEILAKSNSIDKLKPLQHEDSLISPELMDSMATIIAERIMSGSLDPAGLKKLVSDPNNFPPLMQEGTARLLEKPRVVEINPN